MSEPHHNKTRHWIGVAVMVVLAITWMALTMFSTSEDLPRDLRHKVDTGLAVLIPALALLCCYLAWWWPWASRTAHKIRRHLLFIPFTLGTGLLYLTLLYFTIISPRIEKMFEGPHHVLIYEYPSCDQTVYVFSDQELFKKPKNFTIKRRADWSLSLDVVFTYERSPGASFHWIPEDIKHQLLSIQKKCGEPNRIFESEKNDHP